MRIAYLSTFYPFRGGIAQFNAALYRQFEIEHEIKAFTFKRQYPNLLFPGTSQFVSKDDTADKIDAMRLLDTINPASYYLTASHISKFKPQLLIMKYWLPFFGPSLGKVARRLSNRSCRSIAILDNVIPHERRPADLAFTNYFLNSIDGFVTMSSSVEWDLKQLKPDARSISVQHPLYSHFGEKLNRRAARNQLNIDDNAKVLLFFGFIRAYKGLDILLTALSQLPENYFLIIAGEPYGSFDVYQEIIDKNKLENRISKHVRYIPDSDTSLFFSAADVCVLPYKSATQSGIVGIAYHFDLPVIATDTGSLREMVEPFGAGIVVDEADSLSLKNGIEQFFSLPQESFARNIKKYKQEASWEKMAKRIINFANNLSPITIGKML